MKLRLPSKLVAAIMAAASSATFATLATGSAVYGDEAVYTDFSTPFIDSTNNVYYSSQGQFNIESGAETTVILTLNMGKMYSWMNQDGTNHDYIGTTDLISWNYSNAAGTESYTWGINDITNKNASYSGTPALIAASAGAPVGSTLLTYEALNALADSNRLVTLTFNSSASGVSISNGGNVLATTTAVGNSNAAVTTGFHINTNYITSVNLQTASTLDTSTIKLPDDSSVTFVKTREESVGRIVFMGDSITHGVLDGTWRWHMFKTFIDNGIEFDIDGPMSGNHSKPADPDYNQSSPSYAGTAFENVHYAMSSGRTNNMITADTRYTQTVDQLGNNYNVNTGVILIGTNDILSDTGNASGINYDAYKNQFVKLLGGTVTYSANKDVDATWTWTRSESDGWGNMGTILSEMNLEAGDTFYVMSIPTWGVHSNHTNTTDHAAVEAYNGLLEQWVNEYSSTHTGTVKYVDVNKGMVDLTAPSRFFGNKSFFNNGSDGLHPSMQGSLLMAGNLAQAMGIGGRTAGLERSGTSAAGWTKDTTITHDMSHGDSLTLAEGLLNKAGGYTIDFNATFGDGGTPNGDGWLDGNKDSGYGAAQKVTTFSSLTNYLAITVGDGENSGTLKLAEGYITWAGSNGDQVLYCIDNSTNNATLRVAYHPGSVNAGDNVTTGYYVWLNDMLIGQGLEAMHGDNITNGITLGLTSPAGATGSVSNLAWADKAYAPALPSGFMYNAEHAYLPTLLNDKPNRDNTEAAGLGIVFGDTHTSGNAAAGSGNGVVTTTLTNTSSYYGAVNGTGHNGTVSYQVTSSTGMNAFGVVNASVNADTTADTGSAGDVNVVFRGTAEAPITIGTGTYSGQTASFFGTYKGSIAGDLSVEVSHTAMGDIWMGAINADSSTINGSAKLIVNTGSTTGNIYGGSYVNGKILGNSVIEINGGTVNGDIIGAGTNGTIGGYTAITITGGVITGAVNAGTTATGTAAINGTDANGYKSSVTVIGTDARIGGAISAEHVTLKDIENDKEGYTGGMDYYSAAINAGKQLTLDNYTVDRMGSAVTTERVVLKNNSQTTINNLTLTACDITAEAGSTLTLTGTLTLGNTATYSGNIIVEDGITISMSNVDAANVATGGFTNGNSGYFTLGTATLLTPTDASRLHVTDISTYKGEGALANATFAYNESTGVLTATSDAVVRGTYYVNKAITYSPDDAEVYAADRFVIGNGGNLTLQTNLKSGVTVAGAESSTTSAITLNSGTTLTKPTQVTSDIASYVVNEGALLDWSGNTTFGEVMVDLSSTVSGNGTVKVAFQNGGHSGYVKTKPSTGDSAFHGTLDLSGNFNLNSMVGNNANDITYFWHDGSFWHNNNVTVANRVELGENFIMRASGTTTFTGQVTGESLRIGWSGNSGRVHFNNALSAIDTVTLYNGASVEYNKVFTGNTIVQAGTTMAGTNSGTGTTSAAAAQQYHGAVYLQGASNSLAKIFYEDGSMFIENGVHVQGYGAIENQWDKHQYLGGLYTDGEADSVLSFSRKNQGNDAKARYVVLTDSGNFHGTINLSHRKDNSYGLIALGADAQQSLAGAVINFNGTNTIHNTTYTNPTLLAFKKGASISEQESGANFIANDLVAANLQDGAVAGLVGNGSVYAAGLTIGTRGSSADHSFSGTLNVQSLTKTGEGTQTVTSALNLPGALSVQGGTLALTGGATLGGSVEIGTSGTLSLSGASTMGTVQNAGVLNLGGTVAVDTDRLWMYEVASSGSGSSYSDGANGYLTDATLYLVKSNGGTVNSTASFTGKEVTNDGAGNLTFTATDTTTYYVNEALTYDNAKMGGAANLYIAKDAQLTANGAPSSPKVLVGEGAYKLAADSQTLGNNVSLDALNWTGRVVLNGSIGYMRMDTNGLGTVNSYVEFDGVTGFFGDNSATSTTINTNVIIGDGGLKFNNGYGTATTTFKGSLSGSGNIIRDNAANAHTQLTFTGDVSDYTGTFIHNRAADVNFNIRFEGSANNINAAFKTDTVAYGNMNLTFAAADTVVNGTIDNSLGFNGQNHQQINVTVAENTTFKKDARVNTVTVNSGKVATVDEGATMTLTNALTASADIKAAMTEKFDGKGTLVFSTGQTGTTFNNGTQFSAGHQNYTQLIDHLEITGNQGFNNWTGTNDINSLTIETGKSLTITGNARMETNFDLRVQGALTVTEQLQLGHTDSGTGHIHILDGADVKLGGLAINNGTAGKTFTQEGGSLTFTKDGNVFSDANATNTTATFSFLGGTLQAKENSWNFNHAAKLGDMTMDSVGASTNMTISGVLSDADGVHGSITKTGDGTLTLSAANTFTGDILVSGGTLKVGNGQALGAFDSSRNIVISEGGVLDVNGNKSSGSTGYTVTLDGGTLTNSGAVVRFGDVPQFVTNLRLTADSYVQTQGTNFGLIDANSTANSIELGDYDLIKTGSGNYMLDKTTITGTGNLVVREGNIQFRSNGGACSLQSDIVLEGGGVIGEGQGVVLGADVSMKSNAAGSYVSAAVKTEGHNLTVGGTVNMTMSGVISGNGSVTKADANAITMTAANTYTGGTTIENGALILTNSNALSSSVVTFADRTAEQAPYRTLAFTTGASYNGATGALTGGTPINGTIAGLSGYRGTVVADTLTINVAEGGNYEFLHRYSGSTTNDAAVLQVNKLVKQGAGTQVIGGEYTTARGFTDAGLVIANGVDVQGGTLHLKTRGVVTANFDVREGATLKTTDDAANQVTADAAVKYNGTMTLHGTEANTATLNYTDGSTYITEALAVDGNGKLNLTWGKLQYVKALTGTNATLTVDRNSGDGSRGGYVNILSDGSYSGTINLITRAGNEMGGLIMHDAAGALANTVVNFGTTNDKSLVAFITGDGTFDANRVLTTDTFTNGSVGGLDGSKGSVKAAELTINTAEGGNYAYSGDLTVTDLVKSGAGTQALSVTTNLNSLNVQGGTLKVTGGALTVTAPITIGDGGTLSLNATSDGQQSFIHGSVSVGEGGKLVLAGHDATGYKGGDNSLHDIHVQTGGEMLLGFSNSNETFVGNLTLDGTLAMAQGYSGSRIDLFTDNGHSAKVMVSNGANGVVAEGVKLELRQNDSEFAIGTGGSLTVNGTITKTGSGAGNNSFRKTGEGEMIINTALDNGNGVNNINVEEGALTLNAGAKVTGKLTLDADATLNIGEQGNVVLNNADLGSVIHNEGTLTLNGNINVLQTLNTTNATFSEVTYGYLRSATVQIADGGTVNAGENVSWSISGQSATSMGMTSSTFEGGTLTLSGEAGTMWYMNNDERTHTYNAADTTTTAILINAKPQEGTNAVLTVDTNGGVPDRLVSVIVNDTTADLNLTQNTVFAASKLRLTNGGSTVLTGAGTFDLGTPVFSGNNLVMPSGVTVGDAEHWTGAVSISGSMSQWLNGASLSDLCNANSWVEFKGISGVFNSSQTVDANIRFTDNGGEAAFKTTGGFSGKTFTFNGKVSGTGTYYLTNYNNGIQTFKFNGDASAWTGTLKSSNTNATGNQIEISNAFGATLQNEAGNMQVTFKEGAVFSGSLKGSGGTMKVNSEVDAISVNALYLSNGGNVELSGGNYTIGGTSNTQGLFDGNGHLTIKADTNVTLNAHLDRNEDWQFEMKAGADKGITIAQGSSFTVDAKHSQDAAHENDYNLKVIGAQMQGATITASSNREYRLDADNITIANADVELNKRENGGTFDNKLDNSSFTNTGTTEIALTHTESTLVGVHAENGNVVVKNAGSSKDSLKSVKATGADVTLESLGKDTKLSLSELVIGDSQKVTALAGTAAHVADSNTDVATIAIAGDRSKLTAGVGAKLNANLTMGDGSTLEVQKGGLELGCSLTLSAGENLVLHGATMTEDTHYLNIYDLYTGVDSFILNGETIEAEGWYSADAIISSITAYASADTSNPLALAEDSHYVIGFWHGTVSIAEVNVPEPSTSVLSLLALAGMAARRRRK